MTPASAHASTRERAGEGTKRGEVAVSVKDRLGPYERSEARVRDELETLARNEAPGLGADRISPLSPVDDGEQRWALWRCGR